MVCVDADVLGHAAYAPGGPAYPSVCALFPSAVQGSGGPIDRRVLGDLIFRDPSARAALNAAVWPAVKGLVVSELQRLGEEAQGGAAPAQMVGAVEAALLLEAGWGEAMDGVWLLDVGREEALGRLEGRGLSREAAQARLQAQPTAAERRAGPSGACITATIDTSAAKEATEQSFEVAWGAFLASLPPTTTAA